jgi:hypothetical protein
MMNIERPILIGQVVVCIDNKVKDWRELPITIGKQYIVKNFIVGSNGNEPPLLLLYNDYDTRTYYKSTYFITLEVYRENKLDELLKSYE